MEAIEDSAFYKDDLIGLRSLIEAGKVEYVSIVGDHLEFSEADIDNYFIPFLLKWFLLRLNYDKFINGY